MTPDRSAAAHSAANLSVTGDGDGGSAKFIEAVDLSLSFGSAPALRGASLGVAKGEIVAVMGPSGSGKSTLLHAWRDLGAFPRRTPAQLATTVGSVKVTAIATTVSNIGGNVTISRASKGHRPPNFNPNGLKYTPADTGIPASGTDLLLSVVALAILLPILIFIDTATRLSAARREERFAAMRLVGATRTQVSALAAVESTAAALLGVTAGFAIFFGLRIPVAALPFVGQPFFPGQLPRS